MCLLNVGIVFAEDVTPVADTETVTEVSTATKTEPIEESEPTQVTDETQEEIASELASTTPTATTTPLIFSATTTDSLAENEIVITTEATTSPDIAVTASTTNTGTTTNDVTVEASTGDNVASTTATSTIVTGNAVANATITNVVNVNIFNAEALFAFLSRLSGGDNSVDLRDALMSGTGFGCPECVLSTSSLSTTNNITSTSTASIDNAVVVRASTGDNTISSEGGAGIYTGNAYANANVLNVANTNIVDSHYMMLVFNNFGNLAGDIVLPTASFFDQFLSSPQTMTNSTSPVTSSTENTADISNAISTDANSGDNTASSTNSSLTQTGNAFSGSTIVNTVNQNHFGTHKVAIVFRIYGNWSGKLYNLPSSFTAHGSEVGIQFINNPKEVLGSLGGDTVNIATDNTASVQNNVSVAASTGNNQAHGANTQIGSGNAYANANVINVANTNIVGSNWITAIINIFGDWSGNVSFGQPDLWVGTRADFVNGHSGERGSVIYKYTIKNNGDAPAHNIKLSHAFNLPWIDFLGDSIWSIGDLQPGQVREVSYTANIASSIPYGNVPVTSSINVTADETDGNKKDNTDTISVVLTKPIGQGKVNYEPVLHGIPANFVVTKTNSTNGIVTASSTVDYTVTVKNVGGGTDHALIVDEIKNAAGDVIHKEEWDLGAVKSQEEITVTYTAFFNASTTLGVYTNYAYVKSLDGLFPDSAVASSSVTIDKLVVAPLVLVVRPQPIFTPLVASAKTESVIEADTSSSTSTTTEVELVSAIFEEPQDNQKAAVWAAFGNQSWSWIVIIVVMAIAYAYYNHRKRRV
jgi:hypothetical protein